MALLQSQTNWFVTALRDAGFDPRDFTRRPLRDGAYELTGVWHASSGFFFATTPDYVYDAGLGNTYRRWLVLCTPGKETGGAREMHDSWVDVQTHFRNWLAWLTRELGAPDLWAQLHDQPMLLAALRDDPEDNRLFDEGERAQIAKGLAEIRSFLLASHELNQDKQDFVIRRLVYLEDAASRTGRLDWKHILVSTLVTLAVDLAMNSEGVRELFAFAITALRGTSLLPG